MIIPIKCFSCGKPIAHLWDMYVEETKNIRAEGSAIAKEGDKSPEAYVLDKMKITRDCCRRMFLCNADVSMLISSN